MDTQQTLKGFRDFLPEEKRRRDYVAKKVVEAFELFGFEPLETPTLEYASLLLGKYGKEADKLVYSFKDRGDREVALRYDQTVPTARVLAQYQNILPKYFRRYQIQNVFRADKPQKGRFREFTQCDIDVFGTTSPVSDAEIISCTYRAFANVGFPNIILKINDRQVLFDVLSKYESEVTSVLSIIQSIDKLDKMSEEDVAKELVTKGFTESQAPQIIADIKSATLSDNLKNIIDYTINLGVPEKSIVFTPTLARGLDYYTGMIFEVSVPQYGTSSLGGGGRYDKLIGQLGGVNIPAVGIAFGFDRMVEAATELNLIPKAVDMTQVLVSIFDTSSIGRSATLSTTLRNAGITTELYMNPEDSLDKQLKYADKQQFPYVLIQGPEEISKGIVQLKNMKTKEQKEASIEDCIKIIKVTK
jgi:histidyl-tRNA synthetase